MKNLILFVTLLICSNTYSVHAQEDTTTAAKDTLVRTPVKTEYGWFVSTGMQKTKLHSVEVAMPELSVAITFDHCFAAGILVTGMIVDREIKGLYPASQTYLRSGYGGIFLQPIAWHNKKVHATFPVLLGCGGVAYFEKQPESANEAIQVGPTVVRDKDFFIVLEPGFEFEFSIMKEVRLVAGISYRFVGDLNLYHTGEHDFDGLSANVKVKFGNF